MLMNFIGCKDRNWFKGNSKSCFCWGWKILTGKKFPTSVTALVMVFLERLTLTYAELQKWMLKFVDTSILVKHWTIKFIQSIVIVLTYITVKREKDFTLHLFFFKKYYHTFFRAEIITPQLFTHGIVRR